MKKITTITLLLTLIVSNGFSQTGRDIMDKVENKKSPKTVHSLVELRIKEKNGSIKKRLVEVWGKEDEDKLSKEIMVFRTPKSVKNTRFLIKEGTDSDNKWIFLPSLGKVRG